jgi:hypothetical protein
VHAKNTKHKPTFWRKNTPLLILILKRQNRERKRIYVYSGGRKELYLLNYQMSDHQHVTLSQQLRSMACKAKGEQASKLLIKLWESWRGRVQIVRWNLDFVWKVII